MKLFQITLGVLIGVLIACNSSRNDLGALDSVSVIDTASIDTTEYVPPVNTLNNDENGLNQETRADKQALDILEKLFQITGVSFTGASKSGYVKGEAAFRFYRNNLSVNYSLLQYSTTESGNLENFQIEEEGIENTIEIFADWNNTDESVGSGKFFLRLSPDYPKNLYFEIRGSSWIHYAYRELNDAEFEKVKQILSINSKIVMGNDGEKTISYKSIKFNCVARIGTNKIYSSPDTNSIHPSWEKSEDFGLSWGFLATKLISNNQGEFLFGDIITPRGGIFNVKQNGFDGQVYVNLKDWDCSTN